MPAEYAWIGFLEYMGWTDRRVLWAQPDWWVYERHQIYLIEAEWGMLRQSPF